MTTCLRFTVQAAPQPKERARTFIQRGRVITTTPPKTRAYEKWVGVCARAMVPEGWSLEGRMALTVRAYFGDRRARDLSNVVKALEDGMNGIVWKDDSQVKRIEAESFYDKANPRVEVTVERSE